MRNKEVKKQYRKLTKLCCDSSKSFEKFDMVSRQLPRRGSSPASSFPCWAMIPNTFLSLSSRASESVERIVRTDEIVSKDATYSRGVEQRSNWCDSKQREASQVSVVEWKQSEGKSWTVSKCSFFVSSVPYLFSSSHHIEQNLLCTSVSSRTDNHVEPHLTNAIDDQEGISPSVPDVLNVPLSYSATSSPPSFLSFNRTRWTRAFSREYLISTNKQTNKQIISIMSWYIPSNLVGL